MNTVAQLWDNRITTGPVVTPPRTPTGPALPTPFRALETLIMSDQTPRVMGALCAQPTRFLDFDLPTRGIEVDFAALTAEPMSGGAR